MAQTKATAEVLTGFSNDLRNKHDSIITVKKSMDEQLNSFPWDDPIGHAFIADYQEKMNPIDSKLIPNLASYSEYLDKAASIISNYNSNLL